MKQQIDKLIANTLLDEGEIYLPGRLAYLASPRSKTTLFE